MYETYEMYSSEFICTCFQTLCLLKNLAFYMKQDFSAIIFPLPTVECSLLHFKASIPGPRNRGKFGDKLLASGFLYGKPRLFTYAACNNIQAIS